jgi:hypothetical protein
MRGSHAENQVATMKRTKSVSKRPRFRHADQENQTRCVLSTHRSIWMKGYFDTLPLAVRRRLRESPFNLHPACLQTEFVPKVQFQAKQREHAVACGDPAFPENIGKPVALRTQLNEE